MVVYRPQRRMLNEAMAEAKEFSTIEEMKQFIVDDWKRFGYDLFTVEDLILNDDIVDDDRVGWKDSRYILTKRIGDEVYDHPQCIGYCAYETIKKNFTSMMGFTRRCKIEKLKLLKRLEQ